MNKSVSILFSLYLWLSDKLMNLILEKLEQRVYYVTIRVKYGEGDYYEIGEFGFNYVDDYDNDYDEQGQDDLHKLNHLYFDIHNIIERSLQKSAYEIKPEDIWFEINFTPVDNYI